MEHRKGDLLDQPDLDIICHGVNCRGVMGAGIAAQMKTAYPQMYALYRQVCREHGEKPGGQESLLGGALPYVTESGQVVMNLFTQVDPGANAEYGAVRLAVETMFHELDGRFNTIFRIGFCQIGSGIGGLQWEAVKEIISAVNRFYRHELVEVEYAPSA